jgi:hypothetical protein
MAVILGLAAGVSTLLLLLSVYPGLLDELAVLALVSSPFWLPAVCISILVYIDIIYQAAVFRDVSPSRRRWAAAAASALVLNGLLLWGGQARRLAFLLSRPAFEPFVASAPPGRFGTGPLGRRLGVYHVDRFAADPRGGLYFRTYRGPEGFYTRMVTYGFCYSPNPMGSPFGDEKYSYSHLVGDWYCFRALEP